MTKCMGLVLACSFLMGFDTEDTVKKELARLEGVWSFALVEVDGKKQPETPFETNKFIISKEGSYIIVQGPRITRGKITLDATKTPKHYDVTITNGANKGVTTSGIYEIDGDSLKVCLPFRGKERPDALVSKPGSGLLVWTFKRAKQDVKEATIAAGRQELSGTWQAVSYALDGKKAPDEDMKSVQLLIDEAGKATVLRESKVFIASTTKIDPAGNPMTIDVTFTEGDLKGQTAPGIYKVEDDVLTICRGAPDNARPTEFASKSGSGHSLMTYKREKIAQEKPKDPPLTPAEQCKALEEECLTALREWSKSIKEAKTEEEGLKIYKEKSPVPTFVPRFMELAEKHPQDEGAVDALTWVVKMTAPTDTAKDSAWIRAMDILLRDHIGSEKLAICCEQLRFARVKGSEAYLRTALAKSPRRAVQGQACLALAQRLNDQLTLLRTLQAEPAKIKGIEASYGMEYVEELLKHEPEKMEPEIIALFERVSKDFGDVKDARRGPLTDIAGPELFEMRYLVVGKVAPDIEGDDLDGKKFKLSEYRGKVVLLDFWGHW